MLTLEEQLPLCEGEIAYLSGASWFHDKARWSDLQIVTSFVTNIPERLYPNEHFPTALQTPLNFMSFGIS